LPSLASIASAPSSIASSITRLLAPVDAPTEDVSSLTSFSPSPCHTCKRPVGQTNYRTVYVPRANAKPVTLEFCQNSCMEEWEP
jgi:hypothetical protein